MYLIKFDLDLSMMDESDNPESCHQQIQSFLESENFVWEQDGLYFLNEKNNVKPILTIQKLSKHLPWFYNTCKTCELFKVEDKCNLIPTMEYIMNV